MNFIHILNVADLALIAAGLAATLMMMLIGGHESGSRDDRKSDRQMRRPSKSRD